MVWHMCVSHAWYGACVSVMRGMAHVCRAIMYVLFLTPTYEICQIMSWEGLLIWFISVQNTG